MASSQNNENSAQSKTCRCGEKDTNIWTTTTCENNPDKQSHTCSNCQVFKSGPLFISSKGIGWTSWKKRWFVLTRTSLVFFRSDPNAPPPKGGEGNLTLGGIDLNNSGSVVVRADKKLLTVLFPDGRDGRAFTLKAETSEDLHEWKTALENALMQAPSAALAMGQNGIFRNDMADSIEASVDLWRDKRQVKSLVVGRPILLALEDIDGSPSFLEKALRFIEEYGIKVEGILRQSADVEEVERRVQEYEQGKNEFSPGEDAHVIGDCIKHILRELPSSPVPASSCTALVEAYRTDRGSRVNAMRAAIAETFPEPNRHLVQRILKMMRTVASHKHENRMSLSALAACMAPLLLRPLLAGDCDLEDNFNMGGDGSIQLLQAAAAANHAQAIVIILLEEYEKIFDNDLQDGSLSSDLYSESENGDIDYEESTDNDILEDDGYHDADNDHEADIEDDHECTSTGTTDESCTEVENDLSENEDTEDHNKKFATLKENEVVEAIPTASGTTNAPLLQQDTNWEPSSTATVSSSQHDHVHENDILQCKNCNSLSRESSEPCGDVLASTSTELKSVSHSLASNIANSLEKSNEPATTIRQRTVWGRTSARKNLSMESIDYSSEDEIAIKRLEMTKTELQTKITKEVKGNAILQASLERRKEALHERRLALEQDVDRLQEQLQKERDLRASLESGLMNLRPGHVYITSSVDGKTRADLEEIALAEADIINLKQRVADLRGQLSHQLQHGYASLCESCSQHLYARQQLAKSCQQNDVASTSVLDQNENLSMTLDGLPGATSEQVQSQRRNMHSLLNQELSQEEQTESTSQSVIISSQVNSSSPTAVSTAEAISTTEEFSARDENAWLGQHVKTQTQDSPILPDKEPFLMQQIKATSQDSKECLGASSSHSEETKKVARKATSKRTTSRVENSMMGVDSENKKSQIHDSQISPKKQLPQNQETSKTSSSSNKSIGSKTVSSIEEPELVGQNAVSKKSSLRGENVKNVSEDAANRQPSWKQQPNNLSLTSTKTLESSNVSSSEEPATVKRNAASRRSSSREEVLASSSSALTRLTNRLNFLKERRVQLANELQNLDNNRTLASEGPSRAEGPPPRTNSR